MLVSTHTRNRGGVFWHSLTLVARKEALVPARGRVLVPSRDREGADIANTRWDLRSHVLSLCVNWVSSLAGPNISLGVLIAGIALSVLAMGAVADRIAVVVGNDVITESEVLDEVRLTEFQNGQPLDLSPKERRAAAERLVDQQLIRHEMEIAQFPQPAPSEAEALVSAFRQRFPTVEAFQAALEQHEITEQQLAQHLLWQLAVIRFTDLRFRSLPTRSDNASSSNSEEAEASVDRQMESWLKEQRAQTRIQFKEEAFE
jgi:hypothetical protein